jgi:tetratricopeptide (TPR) repeat protein
MQRCAAQIQRTNESTSIHLPGGVQDVSPSYGDEEPPELEEDSADAEAQDKVAKRKQAQLEKEAGNAAYKARNFDEAIEHYNKALELQDDDISFLTNRCFCVMRASLVGT